MRDEGTASRIITAYFAQLGNCREGFDYGCGKSRIRIAFSLRLLRKLFGNTCKVGENVVTSLIYR